MRGPAGIGWTDADKRVFFGGCEPIVSKKRGKDGDGFLYITFDEGPIHEEVVR